VGKVLLCACKDIADSVTDLCFGLLEGEDFLPVVLHANDGPAFGQRELNHPWYGLVENEGLELDVEVGELKNLKE
jgi:hypothetical protein